MHQRLLKSVVAAAMALGALPAALAATLTISCGSTGADVEYRSCHQGADRSLLQIRQQQLDAGITSAVDRSRQSLGEQLS